MIKKFMQGLVRAELEEQISANTKKVLWVYGALGAVAGVFVVGASIRSYVQRVDEKLALLDRLAREEEQKIAQDRELAEANQLLGDIERAKRLTAAHDASEKERAAEREALRELTRQRMTRQVQ